MSNKTGVFGKLPAHGDFIYRDLPTHFINIWDQWLQGFVGSSKEQIGDQWLDVYMTSPIWRFVLSEGVIDNNSWAGILLPSVDRVGRYFPFSVVTRLPEKTSPTDFICNRPNWFETMEDVSLKALDGRLKIDELVEELNDSNPMRKDIYNRGSPLNTVSNMVIRTPKKDQPLNSVLPFMLDACLTENLSSYSIWGTRGSERIEPCLFVTKGLPQLSGVSAMMDGRWRAWNWQEPFPLKNG